MANIKFEKKTTHKKRTIIGAALFALVVVANVMDDSPARAPAAPKQEAKEELFCGVSQVRIGSMADDVVSNEVLPIKADFGFFGGALQTIGYKGGKKCRVIGEFEATISGTKTTSRYNVLMEDTGSSIRTLQVMVNGHIL